MASDWTGQTDANAFADFFSQDTPNDYLPVWGGDALPNPASRDLSSLLLSTDDTALPDLNPLSYTHPEPINSSNAADDPFQEWIGIDQLLDMSTFDQDAFDLEWQHQHKDHFPEQPTTMTTDEGNAAAETAAAETISSGVEDTQACCTSSKIR